MYTTIFSLWQQPWLLAFSKSMQIKAANYVKQPVHVSRYISEISDRGILNTLRPFLLYTPFTLKEERLLFKWEETLILYAASKKHTKPTLHTQPYIIRIVLPSQDLRTRNLIVMDTKLLILIQKLSFSYLFSTFISITQATLIFVPLTDPLHCTAFVLC